MAKLCFFLDRSFCFVSLELHSMHAASTEMSAILDFVLFSMEVPWYLLITGTFSFDRRQITTRSGTSIGALYFFKNMNTNN